MVVICEHCGAVIEYDNGDIVLGGFPHIECPVCGGMIALF